MVKISILTLYRRIFITSAFRRKTVIVGLACLIWFFVAFFMDLSQCHPFQDAFNPKYLFTRHCINLQGYYWGISAANLVLDVIVLSLPLHMVWSLQLPMKQKLYLSGVFLLGGVVCIAGAMRIVAIGILQKEDITVTMAAEYLWTQVEPATAIFCACVVTYRPLFTNINLNISKFSGLFSKSGNIGSSDSSDWKDINDERNTKLQSHGGSGWLGREVVHFQDLNAKELVDTPSYQADRKRPYIESKPSRSIDIMDARPKPFPKDNYSRG